MKCPFRTITSFTKQENTLKHRQGGGYEYGQKTVPCNHDEAHNVETDFSDCLEFECPYYIANPVESCQRVSDERRCK